MLKMACVQGIKLTPEEQPVAEAIKKGMSEEEFVLKHEDEPYKYLVDSYNFGKKMRELGFTPEDIAYGKAGREAEITFENLFKGDSKKPEEFFTKGIKGKDLPKNTYSYVPKSNIPKPKISTEEKSATSPSLMSDIVQTIDENDFSPSMRKFFRKEYVPFLKAQGINFIDAYHVTDTPIEVLKKQGIRGSTFDYVGNTSGNLRESSVYVFLDPDDIKAGFNGVLGASGDVPNVVHIKIPVEEIENMKWDGNFNVTFGTYTSSRILGDIPKSWISAGYKYYSKKIPINESSLRTLYRQVKGKLSPKESISDFGEKIGGILTGSAIKPGLNKGGEYEKGK